MAVRKKKNDDNIIPEVDAVATSFKEEPTLHEETGVDEESGFYTMGEIKIADEESDEAPDEEFKKASKTMKAEEDENEEEWTDDDSVNWTDTDDFLDAENVDPENFEYEKDDY